MTGQVNCRRWPPARTLTTSLSAGMGGVGWLWLTLALVTLQPGMVNGGNPDAKRLYDDLLSNYNKLVRPVVNVSEAVTVRLKLKLSQLIDVVRERKSRFFLLAGPSQDVFLLPHIPYEGKGVVYFLYITL